MSHEFQHFLQFKIRGIISQCTYPLYATTKWGGGKEKHHHLDVSGTLPFESFVPQDNVHLINRHPSHRLKNQTPYFHLHGNIPIMITIVLLVRHSSLSCHQTREQNLPTQSTKCALLGYASHKKVYLCDDLTIRHIHTSRNVVFS